MATINPYAGNVVHFPPGTPVSVMNAYIQAYTRNQDISQQLAYRQSQYDPWSETINQFQKQVLNPYLNEWLSQPFQDYRQTYNTNEQMRQQQALYDAQTQAKQQQALDEWQLSQQKASALGSAGGGLLDALQPEQIPPSLQDVPPPPTPPSAPAIQPITPPQPATPMPDASQYDFGGAGGAPGGGYGGATDIGAGGGYGGASPYEGPPPLPSAAPAAAPMPPSAVAPTPPPNLQEPTPFQPYTPTLADAIRTLSGADPLKAGLMIEALQKNPNLAGIMDPARQAALNAATLKALAQGTQANAAAGNQQSQADARNAQLPQILANLVATGQLTQEKANLVAAQAGLTTAKTTEQTVRNDVLQNASPEEIKGLLFKSPRAATMFSAQMDVARAAHPDWSDAQIKKEAIDQTQALGIERTQAGIEARLPAQIAGNELPKTDAAIRQVGNYMGVLGKGEQAALTLKDSGFLPADGRVTSIGAAMLQRQINAAQWNSTEVQNAVGVLTAMKNGLQVGFDRTTLGDQGARIGAAYNLPADPTMVPYEYMNGQFKVMRTAAESDLENLNTTRQGLYQSVYGSRGPKYGIPPIGGNTGGGAATPPTKLRFGPPPGFSP